MLRIPADTTTREGKNHMRYHASPGKWLVFELFLLKRNTFMHCRLIQQVSHGKKVEILAADDLT